MSGFCEVPNCLAEISRDGVQLCRKHKEYRDVSHDQCKPCDDSCGNAPWAPCHDAKQKLEERQKEKMNTCDVYILPEKNTIPEPGTGLSEVQLIGVLILNLTKLNKAEAKRVIEYAERLYDDKFGKDKVYR